MKQTPASTVPGTPSCEAVITSLRHTLAAFQTGRFDLTTRVNDREFIRASYTPDGPGTIHITWSADPATTARAGRSAMAWGPGGDWLLDRVGSLCGDHDTPPVFPDAQPVVAAALQAYRTTRFGASGTIYHDMLPVIIAQRITAGEAMRQWSRLCTELGESAPGPFEGLRLPPSPETLANRPAWWFHPLGIETKRARALNQIARIADRLWQWSELPSEQIAQRLAHLPGIGAWTIGSTLATALGDPDSVPVGDFHFPNTVAWALAKEPRGTDDRMLELLEPYRGQRGRVINALGRSGHGAPRFGPRKPVLPMHRW